VIDRIGWFGFGERMKQLTILYFFCVIITSFFSVHLLANPGLDWDIETADYDEYPSSSYSPPLDFTNLKIILKVILFISIALFIRKRSKVQEDQNRRAMSHSMLQHSEFEWGNHVIGGLLVFSMGWKFIDWLFD